MFLEDCKYVVKEIKYIIGDIEISSDSCRESSDQERSDEEILMKKILMKKIVTQKIKKYTNITNKKVFIVFLYIYIYIYMKMVNKYHQENKEKF